MLGVVADTQAAKAQPSAEHRGLERRHADDGVRADSPKHASQLHFPQQAGAEVEPKSRPSVRTDRRDGEVRELLGFDPRTASEED